MNKALRVALPLAAVVFSAYLITVQLSPALQPQTPLEAVLEKNGYEITRASSTATYAISHGSTAPSLVVLVMPGWLASSEQSALRHYVQEGGDLWFISPHPESDIWQEPKTGLGTFPGALYAADGSAALVHVPDAPTPLPVSGLRALNLNGSAQFVALMSTTADSFRDTNGNARLDSGEPSGPFVFVASAKEGEGNVIVVATESPDALPAEIISDLASGSRAAGVGVVVYGRMLSAWSLPARSILTVASLPPFDAPVALAVTVGVVGLATSLIWTPQRQSARAAATEAAATIQAARERLKTDPAPAAARILTIIEGQKTGDK
jgi:hypothetical protein